MRMRRGFTLVEVLVALLILALMATLAWRGVDGMLRAREISQTALEHSARLQTVLAQWQQDLEQLQEAQGIPALRFDGLHLRLTRRQPEGLQVVVWWLGDGRLKRWAGTPVRGLQALRQSFEESQQPLALASRSLNALEGVSGWQMAYFFGNAWANAQSSGDLVEDAALRDKQQREAGTTPAAGAGGTEGKDTPGPQNPRSALPKAVRLQLDFAPGPFGGPLVRQVLLGAS